MGLHHAESQFSEGWLISSSGFAKAAVEQLKSEFRENLRMPVVSLGTVFLGGIRWDYLILKAHLNFLKNPQER